MPQPREHSESPSAALAGLRLVRMLPSRHRDALRAPPLAYVLARHQGRPVGTLLDDLESAEAPPQVITRQMTPPVLRTDAKGDALLLDGEET